MNKYKIEFYGKVKGAIGSFSSFVVYVEAEDETKALVKLYDNYEHVLGPKVVFMHTV